MVVGDGMDPDAAMGPLQNLAQYERVRALLADARAAGTVQCGGEIDGRPGYFIKPAIVTGVSNGTRIVDEEQFGPILPLIRFSNVDEAVRLANDSPYGLGGSVWSGSDDAARAVAMRLDSGTVWINRHQDIVPHIPFGGAKESGIGVELGAEGLHSLMQLQVVSGATAPGGTSHQNSN
jgi:acyl-CoA reductase-like NAD-dependent aldehyde dehydrogenase